MNTHRIIDRGSPLPARRNKQNITMKKNLIYIVTFLLCGAMFFSSCEDLLDVDSNRVEYEFDGWTFNDSVYSVLGILNTVQKVGDRHVLLGELRGDLLTINEKALKDADLADISNFDFDPNNNKYLDATGYFAIINNCNLFLSRVDTAKTYDNIHLMMREFVAVKSIRAWTYMQLMKNHAVVPYITEPILTHEQAEEAMSQPGMDQLSVINALIEDIAKYENPKLYQMPLWKIDGFKIMDGVATSKLFMPIRVLLGDLYLWRAAINAENGTFPLAAPNLSSDYMMAAKCYYDYLTEDNEFTDASNSCHLSISDEVLSKMVEGNAVETTLNFNSIVRFMQGDIKTPSSNMVAIIPFATNENSGAVSSLDEIFAPVGVLASNQIVASKGLENIALAQQYVYREVKDAAKESYKYHKVLSKWTPGDLRYYASTAYQLGEDKNQTRHSGIITKFNVEEMEELRLDNEGVITLKKSCLTSNIILDRPEYVYLRFAEALLGLEREGYSGAKELAMTVLKSGASEEYKLWWHPETKREKVLDKDGKEVTMPLCLNGTGVEFGSSHVYVYKKNYKGDYILDSKGQKKKFYQYVPVYKEVTSSLDDHEPVVFDFSEDVFDSNHGIHSRGSGSAEFDDEFALVDSVVAKYNNLPSNGETVTISTVSKNDEGYILFVPTVTVKNLEDAALNDMYETDARGNVRYKEKATEVVIPAYDVTDDMRLDYMYDKLIDEMALEMAFEGHRFGDLVRFATALGKPEFLADRVAKRNGDIDNALRAKLMNKNNWFIPLPDNYMSVKE